MNNSSVYYYSHNMIYITALITSYVRARIIGPISESRQRGALYGI